MGEKIEIAKGKIKQAVGKPRARSETTDAFGRRCIIEDVKHAAKDAKRALEDAT